MTPDKRKLQTLIDNAVRAHNAVHKADAALYTFAAKYWEFDTFEDNIVDGCLGGCGNSRGMTAEEFIETMENAKD